VRLSKRCVSFLFFAGFKQDSPGFLGDPQGCPRQQCQGQHGAHGGWFDNRTEGLIEVNTWALCKTAENPARLVSLKGTVSLKLVLENPLAGDDMGP
jgi:hypothetical protein